MNYSMYTRRTGENVQMSGEALEQGMRTKTIQSVSFSCASSGTITYDESDEEHPFVLHSNAGRVFRGRTHEDVLRQAVFPSFLWWEDGPTDFSIQAES